MTGTSGADADTPWSSLLGQVSQRTMQASRSNPRLAIRMLHPSNVTDPALLAILRAEVHLRLGQRTHAATEALRGVTLAAQRNPLVAEEVLTAATVLTDISCATDDPHSPQVCADLHELAGQHGATGRVQLADILHAVAVYHREDCARGRAIFAALLDQATQSGDGPLNDALTSGLNVLDRWCTTSALGPVLLTRPLSPVPGGLLHPDPAAVTPAWLEQRIQMHRCAEIHAGSEIGDDRR